MFTENELKKIEEQYNMRCAKYPSLMEDVSKKISLMEKKHKDILMYFYSELALADLAETDFEVFLDYAIHGAMLWEKRTVLHQLPEKIFLDYVLNPRVDEEELDICRTAFYYLFLNYLVEEDKFWNKEKANVYQDKAAYLDGMSDEKIAEEVNFWCAGEAAYVKSEGRMVSARTVYASARGNEKELAVYTIHALRSLGIPAKTAAFAKTEENGHIWIEAYVSNEWRPMAVCEPWYHKEENDDQDESLKKRMIARKARAEGKQFVKAKHWKNEEKEKFFYGDIFSMNMRAKLLKELSEKDQIDMKYDIMEEHFRESVADKIEMDENIFISYVLNPRIYDETLGAWRGIVKSIFPVDMRMQFRENPNLIWKELDARFESISVEELGRAYISPKGSLRLGKVSEQSGKILCAAIARSCQIPARYCAETQSVEYWNGNQFEVIQTAT